MEEVIKRGNISASHFHEFNGWSKTSSTDHRGTDKMSSCEVHIPPVFLPLEINLKDNQCYFCSRNSHEARLV